VFLCASVPPCCRNASVKSTVPARVRIVEVGPRDGLQNENDPVPTATKIAFVDALSKSGLTDIEVTSFVNPKAVPQMADAADVLNSIERSPGVRYSALIPNLKGFELWLGCAGRFALDQRAIALFTAASETFNRRNTNAGIGESIETFRVITDRLRTDMAEELPFIRGYISTAVRCPFEGPIEPAKVLDVCSRLLDLGVDEVSLGDTIGAAVPTDIERLLDAVLTEIDARRIALHLHDTRGTALANVVTAMRYGIAIFDSSSGGLGGCPFAPGAFGNLATEDLLYMLNGMNIETGVDLTAVAAASESIRAFIGHPLASKELQALEAAGF